MPLVTVDAFRDLPRGARLLGVDLGSKTIGLALTDVERLKAIAAEHGVAGLVVGLPLNMDGSEGPRAQSTRAFVRNLEAVVSLPVVLWDERLTTAAVTRTLIEA